MVLSAAVTEERLGVPLERSGDAQANMVLEMSRMKPTAMAPLTNCPLSHGGKMLLKWVLQLRRCPDLVLLGGASSSYPNLWRLEADCPLTLALAKPLATNQPV